ncbi:MAG: DUF4124 domain-containing protein [Sphingomonadaceae bacterium]
MKPALLLLAILSLPATADSIHKCVTDGKVSYSELPCPPGTGSASTLAMPPAPDPDPEASAELERMKAQAAALAKARLIAEGKSERDIARGAREARAQAKKCARLRLDKQAAEEEAKSVAIQNEARARARVKRAADNLALECSAQ